MIFTYVKGAIYGIRTDFGLFWISGVVVCIIGLLHDRELSA
jgi:hypothetical protein